MIISDIHTSFENGSQSSCESHEWQLDRLRYTEQQLGEMPSWIKTKKEQSSNIQNENNEAVDINTLSEMQN